MWRGLAAALLVVSFMLAACLDFGALGGGDTADGGGGGPGTGGCAPDEKPCAGACVKVNDPSVGCSGACTACPAPIQAAAACALDNGSYVCAQGTCNLGYADCDNDAESGCETRATTPTNCGACEVNCGGQFCERQGDAFVCSATCDMPNLACTGDGGVACIDPKSDPDNCGKCGIVCAEKDGYQICDNSSCVTGEANCDAGTCDQGGGQCVPTDTTRSPNCGECGMDCKSEGLSCCKGRSLGSGGGAEYTCTFPFGGPGDGGQCNP